MKKLLLLSALLIGAGFAASAQTVIDNPANRPYFGIRASLDVSLPGKVKVNKNVSSKLYDASAGFSIGGIYNAPVVANFYVQPGLSLYYNTTGINHDFITNHELLSIDHASLRKFGFRVPVMLGYHFDFRPCKVHIFTGPELDVGFVNDHYLKGTVAGNDVKNVYSEYGDKGNLNRVDCYWKVGLGFQIQENYYVDVTGAFGLTNQIRHTSDGYPKWHENYLSVTLGYNF